MMRYLNDMCNEAQLYEPPPRNTDLSMRPVSLLTFSLVVKIFQGLILWGCPFLSRVFTHLDKDFARLWAKYA